ncbi:E3 ubiquitin ligase [Tilletia horrida]|uniref:E3 ubiquitin ligase n=1 Tax=Tilletia horrida TaxID=155126 RepID=A0AAN6GRY2_9BASI|nr:E3 ubiquitin ligase [Tilletia horrida]KAK0553238.1 E3 ubiquitin ligase [Tilletia horrida]KAK0565278.1 E3 ubiquitin ligase [Tilletia horrida]
MVDKKPGEAAGGSRAEGGGSSSRKRPRSPSSSESPSKRKAQGAPSNSNDSDVANGSSSSRQRAGNARTTRSSASRNGIRAAPLAQTTNVLSTREAYDSSSRLSQATNVAAAIMASDSANGLSASESSSVPDSAQAADENELDAAAIPAEERKPDSVNHAEANSEPPADEKQDTNNHISTETIVSFPDRDGNESRETLLAHIKILERRLQAAERASTLHTRALNGLYERCNCDVCFELLTRPCIIAPCGHMACRECLVAYWKQPATDEVPIAPGLTEALRAEQQRRRTLRRAKRCPVCRTESTRPPAEAWLMKQIVGDVERWKSGEDREATQEIVRRTREVAAEAERRRQERTRREAGPSRPNASRTPSGTSQNCADSSSSTNWVAKQLAERVAKLKKAENGQKEKGKAVDNHGLNLFPSDEEEDNSEIWLDGALQSQASQADIVASVRAEREAQMGEETWTDLFAEEDDALAMRWDHQDAVYRCPRCMQEIIDEICDYCDIRLRRPAGGVRHDGDAVDLARIGLHNVTRRGYAADSDAESYLITGSDHSDVELENPWMVTDHTDDDDFYVDDLEGEDAASPSRLRRLLRSGLQDLIASGEYSARSDLTDEDEGTDEENPGTRLRNAVELRDDEDDSENESDQSSDYLAALANSRADAEDRSDDEDEDEDSDVVEARPRRRFGNNLQDRTSSEIDDIISALGAEIHGGAPLHVEYTNEEEEEEGSDDEYDLGWGARDLLRSENAHSEDDTDQDDDDDDDVRTLRPPSVRLRVRAPARQTRRPILSDSDEPEDDDDGDEVEEEDDEDEDDEDGAAEEEQFDDEEGEEDDEDEY